MLALNGSLKPYLVGSAGIHVGALILAGLLMGKASAPPQRIYRIDFIGAAPTIINRSRRAPRAARRAAKPKKKAPAPKKAAPKPAAKPAAKPAPPKAAKRPPPQTDPDAFNLSKKKPRRPLPKPSFLAAAVPKPVKASAPPAPAAPEVPPAPVPAPVEETAPVAEEAVEGAPEGSPAGDGPEAMVTPDMPDFPYPWYISRVRKSLWDNWAKHRPAGAAECEVAFTIVRTGKMVSPRVDVTSGDRAFDVAALSAVQDAAPFPPLPRGFPDRFLRVHVQFKSFR